MVNTDISTDISSVAKRMAEQRKKENLSYRDLSEKTGLSRSTLQRYENGGIKNIPLDKLKILATALNCSAEHLMAWDKKETKEFVTIPIIGSVVAGVPLEESQDIEGYVEISGDTSNTFALRVHGDSMNPELHDKDTVIIKRQNSYKNGDIVVARVNGYEYTIKKLRKDNNNVILIPFNRDYDPLVFSESDVAIEGKVVEVRRQYA